MKDLYLYSVVVALLVLIVMQWVMIRQLAVHEDWLEGIGQVCYAAYQRGGQ
jgi:hypothetical protein